VGQLDLARRNLTQKNPLTSLKVTLNNTGIYLNKISILIISESLTHSRPLREQKKNMLEDLWFSIVTIHNTSPLWESEIQLFRYFPELKIAYFNKKILNLY